MAARKRPVAQAATKVRKVKMPRVVATSAPRSWGVAPILKGSLLAGGVVAAGAAATGAVLMRRQLIKLAESAASEALAAGHSVGTMGTKLVRSMKLDKIDMARLLALLGVKKPSLFRRLLPPIGAISGLLAAAGTALFLFAPKLAELQREKRAQQDRDEERSPVAGETDRASDNSIGNGEHGDAHAVR